MTTSAKKKRAEALEVNRAIIEETLSEDWFEQVEGNPFEARVRLQGPYGTVLLRDPPASSLFRERKDDDPKATLKARAFGLRSAFVSVEGAGDECVWPAKDANLAEWMGLLDRLPTSVYLRITQAVDALGYEQKDDGEGVHDAGE